MTEPILEPGDPAEITEDPKIGNEPPDEPPPDPEDEE